METGSAYSHLPHAPQQHLLIRPFLPVGVLLGRSALRFPPRGLAGRRVGSMGHHPTFQRVLRILHGTRGQIRRHHTQPGDHSARTGWTLWEYKRSQERLFLHPASDGASRTTPAPEHTRPVGYRPARVDYRIETLPSGPQRSTVARCQAR